MDITPYRRLIKEGIDLPEAMRKQPQLQNMQRLSLDDAFKSEEHSFRVAIVCAMWLTGFEVPCLSTLYLDKPLKAHTLMQAIVRANRVNEGKNNGMIVDYCGILKNLRKALATIMHQLHSIVNETIETLPDSAIAEKLPTYDISKINFDRLRQHGVIRSSEGQNEIALCREVGQKDLCAIP